MKFPGFVLLSILFSSVVAQAPRGSITTTVSRASPSAPLASGGPVSAPTFSLPSGSVSHSVPSLLSSVRSGFSTGTGGPIGTGAPTGTFSVPVSSHSPLSGSPVGGPIGTGSGTLSSHTSSGTGSSPSGVAPSVSASNSLVSTSINSSKSSAASTSSQSSVSTHSSASTGSVASTSTASGTSSTTSAPAQTSTGAAVGGVKVDSGLLLGALAGVVLFWM